MASAAGETTHRVNCHHEGDPLVHQELLDLLRRPLEFRRLADDLGELAEVDFEVVFAVKLEVLLRELDQVAAFNTFAMLVSDV